jgi:hypothetical protein
MGTLGLIKASVGSIFIQRKLQAAIDAGDSETSSQLISRSIVTILKRASRHGNAETSIS